MACNDRELCAGCFRDNEEETAVFWCNDCAEPTCRHCGKVHRRFTTPHDVIDIQDLSNISRSVPKNCILHPSQKLILFCSDHDKILCRVCLSESHKDCKNITEIEKAALGIKDTNSIIDLKGKMTTLKEAAEKITKQQETRMAGINDEKQKADNHLRLIRECINSHLTRIENELSTNYDQIVKQITDDSKHVAELGQTLKSQVDEIDNVVGKSSECHLFHIIKHLNTTKISEINKMKEIKNKTHFPLDIFPTDFVKTVDAMFKSLLEKKSSIAQVESGDTENKQTFQRSQVEITERTKRYMAPSVIKQDGAGEFVACCFTEDNHLVVIDQNEYIRICRLKIYDQQRNDKTICLSFKALDVCMYDKSNALVTWQRPNRISVVDISSLKEVRTINLCDGCDYTRYGDPKHGSIIFCHGREIWVLIHFLMNVESLPRICSIDFNGNMLRVISLPKDVCDICYDGYRTFYMTHRNRNDITCTTNGDNVFVFHSSIDLREGCRILLSGNNTILLLESDSNTVYKLNIPFRTRSVEKRGDISKATHFCFNSKTRELAVTMGNGKTIKIFTI